MIRFVVVFLLCGLLARAQDASCLVQYVLADWTPMSLNPALYIPCNNNVIDETGTYTPSWNGTEAYVDGPWTGVYGANFNNTDAGIDVGSGAITNWLCPSSENVFSIAGWFRIIPNNRFVLFGRKAPGTGTALRLLAMIVNRPTNSELTPAVYLGGGANSTTDYLDSGEWEHVCFVWTGTVCLYYRNGELRDTYSTIGTQANTTDHLWLGKFDASSNLSSPIGSIAQVLVVNRVLAPSEISSLFQWRGN